MFRVKRPFTVSAFALLFSNIFLMLTENKRINTVLFLAVVICLIFVGFYHCYAKHMLIIVICIVLSALSFNLNVFISEYSEKLCGEDKRIDGTVNTVFEGTSRKAANIILSDCRVDGIEIFGKLKVYTENSDWAEVGDRINFIATKLVSSEAEGVFRFHSLSSRTFLTAFPDEDSFSRIEEAENKGSPLTGIKNNIREKFLANQKEENAGVIIALITGEKDYFSYELTNNLKYSGVSHIFAVSGMHLSLWTSLFFLFFKRRAKTKFLPNFAAIIFVILYSIFTGFSPSVLRAGIMLTAVFLASVIKRHSDPLNSLGISGTLLLLYNPFLAGDVSFLLSFTATFALIFFSSFILPTNNKKHKKPTILRKRLKAAFSAFVISLCVILTTLPITAVFFGYVSLLSPFSSVIITPLAELSMITGGLAAIIPSGNFLSDFLFSLTEDFTGIIILICNKFGKIDLALQATPLQIILPWFFISFIITALVFLRFKSQQKTFFCILSCITILLAITAVTNTLSRGETKIFIPGNENSTIISIVNKTSHTAAVFGTGGSYSNASKTVNYLNTNGILKTDTLIIPRNSATENSCEEYLTNQLLPNRIIETENKEKITDSSYTLWNGVRLRSRISSDFAASVLTADNIKIVICTLPASDFEEADPFFASGDILITRNTVPESIDTNNFKTVIIMTERKYSSLPENTYTTATSDIEIVVKGDSYAVHG